MITYKVYLKPMQSTMACLICSFFIVLQCLVTSLKAGDVDLSYLESKVGHYAFDSVATQQITNGYGCAEFWPEYSEAEYQRLDHKSNFNGNAEEAYANENTKKLLNFLGDENNDLFVDEPNKSLLVVIYVAGIFRSDEVYQSVNIS